jgi:hypothetical protein
MLLLQALFKPGDPPQPPLRKGENSVKVRLFKEDLGGALRNKLTNA